MIFVPFLLRCFLEQRLEEFPRVGCWNLHDVFRPAGRDDGAAAAAAARPANPEPTTITSTSSSHFAGIGSLHAAFAVTDIKEEVANRAEEDKNFLLLRVFMIFSLENNKLWI